jgi:hypothetical protein
VCRVLQPDKESKENHVGSMISRYRKKAPAEILDNFYQFTPSEIKTLADYAAWHPNPHTDAAEVLSVALEIDSSMQAFYRRAAQMAPSEAITKLFENLADAIKDKKRDQASNTSLIQDI